VTAQLVPIDDLVTVDEIAKRLHWSINATCNVVQGRDGRYKLKFPKPIVGTAKRGVWLWTDVWEWFENTAPKTVEARRRASRAAAMTCKRDWNHGQRSA
jgi:hypothetical protein